MRIKIVFFIICMVLLVGIVYAIDFIPQGNINLKNIFNITNVPFINSINFTAFYNLFISTNSTLSGRIDSVNSSLQTQIGRIDTINSTIISVNSTLDAKINANNLSTYNWVEATFLKIVNMFTKSEITGMISGNRTEIETNTNNAINNNISAVRTDIQNNATSIRSDLNNAISGNRTQIETNTNNAISGNVSSLRADINNNYTSSISVSSSMISGNRTEIESNTNSAITGNVSNLNTAIINNATSIRTDLNGAITGNASAIRTDINNNVTQVNANIRNNWTDLEIRKINVSNEGNLNVNSSIYSQNTTWWATVSGWVSGWFVKTGSNLDFNGTKLNATIDQKLLGEYWFFYEESLIYGTSDGTINSTQQYDDYDTVSYNLTEEVINGLLYYANTSANISTDVNKICIRYKAIGDDYAVSLWSISLGTWEGYMTLTADTIFNWACSDIRDSSDHLVGNKLLMRIIHTGSASTQHKLYIDAMYVSSGYTPRVGNEVDPLSFHKDANIEHDNYNISADYFKGKFNWTSSDNYNIFDGSTLDFNETKLNNSIDSRSSILNVNKSNYWDNMNTINTTQMQDNGGVLNILVSWLTSLFYQKSEVYNKSETYNNSANIETNYNISANYFKGNLDWTNLTNYPVECPAGTYITKLNDSVTCTSISSSSYDNITISRQANINNTIINNSGITTTGNVTADYGFLKLAWGYLQSIPNILYGLWNGYNANNLLLNNGTAIGYNETVLNNSVVNVGLTAGFNSTANSTYQAHVNNMTLHNETFNYNQTEPAQAYARANFYNNSANVNIGNYNISVNQGYMFCLTLNCSHKIYYNGSATIIQ